MRGLLEGQTAFITGGARSAGIGFATARLFLEHGARVAIADVEDMNPAAAAEALGENAVGYVCDVRSEEQCRDAVARAVKELGQVSVLISNAGVVQPRRVLEIARSDYDFVMDVNLRGTLNIAQAVLPGMAAHKAGSVVCISSITGQRGGIFGGAHYSASKAGILGLVKTMAREFGRSGTRVNAVCPGVIVTGFTSGPKAESDNAKAKEEVPLGRLGDGDDVAGACLFLASGLARYVTGAVIDVNGGLHIH
jgi:NAD(P)-dependent dehydrogenase (short-subunit alcohol dehydrogenase family)